MRCSTVISGENRRAREWKRLASSDVGGTHTSHVPFRELDVVAQHMPVGARRRSGLIGHRRQSQQLEIRLLPVEALELDVQLLNVEGEVMKVHRGVDLANVALRVGQNA
jgi:hypothetical protein